MQLEDIIAEIKAKHRRRCYAMESRKIVDLRTLSLARIELGWHKDLPKEESERIKDEAKKLVAADRATKKSQLRSRLGWGAKLLKKARAALKRLIDELMSPFEPAEEQAKKEMAKLVVGLPIWKEWGESVRGLGEVSLAVVIAEAGDLWNYGTRQLRKRMCLMPGQNRVPDGLSKEARRDAWIARGYSPRRRSLMWNIGDAMIKAQVRVVKDEKGEDTGERTAIGPYGEIYLRRKAEEHAHNPDMSDMHCHRRAQRYMEQRLLEDIRLAWRRTMPKPETERYIGLGHNSRRGAAPLYPA